MAENDLKKIEKAFLRILEKSEASLERRLMKIDKRREADRKEFVARHKEIDATLEEVAKKLEANAEAQEKIDIQLGGIGNNLGSFAEDFFYGNAPAAIKKDTRFKKEFSYERNVSGRGSREYDIVGVNGDCVIVIEVKSMLKGKHFQSFKSLLPHFVKDFPQHKGKKIYGAFATMSLNRRDANRIKQKIVNDGLLLLTQASSSAAGVFKPDSGQTNLKDFG